MNDDKCTFAYKFLESLTNLPLEERDIFAGILYAKTEEDFEKLRYEIISYEMRSGDCRDWMEAFMNAEDPSFGRKFALTDMISTFEVTGEL